MDWLESISSLLEQGSNLDGVAGEFFSYFTPIFVGTLIFITFLHALRRVPAFKAIQEYALTESAVDRKQSEFIKMFKEPKTRIRINVSILIGLIILMLLCALVMFGVVSVPFLVWHNPNNEMSLFSVSMICLLLVSLLLWSMWLLNRFKEQTAKAISLDRE
ncbi:hypothetical protein AB6C58_23980 [Vibrio splendidus]